MIAVGILLFILSTGYGIARWYQVSERSKPFIMGATFIPSYAESLSLDAKETLDALTQSAGIRNFRLVSYWKELEPTPGQYNFERLDWQFKKVEEVGGTVTLSVGLRQPRWPECHAPDWAMQFDASERQARLQTFIKAVMAHYKDSPALVSYQLENEFLLESFGHCPKINPKDVVAEMADIKSVDDSRPVIISRSNNFPAVPIRQPVPDQYGISVYRRVWDGNLTKRYFDYPMPPLYYAFLAGMQKIVHGKPSILHELQAEAWPPNGQPIPQTSLEEQNKSINAERLQKTIKFGKDTGLRDIYLWGAEYWYYRMIRLNDPSLWNVASEAFRQTR